MRNIKSLRRSSVLKKIKSTSDSKVFLTKPPSNPKSSPKSLMFLKVTMKCFPNWSRSASTTIYQRRCRRSTVSSICLSRSMASWCVNISASEMLRINKSGSTLIRGETSWLESSNQTTIYTAEASASTLMMAPSTSDTGRMVSGSLEGLCGWSLFERWQEIEQMHCVSHKWNYWYVWLGFLIIYY